MAVVVIFIVVGARHSTLDAPDDYVEAIGTVAEIHRSTHTDPAAGTSTDYDTDIRFRTTSGENMTFRSEFGSRRTEVGEHVTVFYDPSDPTMAEITADTGFPKALGLLTIFTSVIAAFVLLAASQRIKDQRTSRLG